MRDGHAQLWIEDIKARLAETWFSWQGEADDNAVFYFMWLSARQTEMIMVRICFAANSNSMGINRKFENQELGAKNYKITNITFMTVIGKMKFLLTFKS